MWHNRHTLVDRARMRVAIIGGGTIARLFIEHIRRGDLGDADVVTIVGRNDGSRGKPLATEFGISYVTSLRDLERCNPDVVVEAASHAAVRELPVLTRDTSRIRAYFPTVALLAPHKT